MKTRRGRSRNLEGLPRTAFLERTLLEMSRNALIELADNLAGEADLRRREEGDAGPFFEKLAEFLQGKSFAIIGGVAVRSYLRDRPTMDLDLMIHPKHWLEMVRFLYDQRAVSAGRIEDTFLHNFEEFELNFDVRVAGGTFELEALGAFLPRRFKKWILRVVKPEYLVVMKVEAYSGRKRTKKGVRDHGDVRHLLNGHADEAAVRALLQKHRPDLLPVLDEILGG